MTSESYQYHVFMSYAYQDTALARNLAIALEKFGLRVWIPEAQMAAGRSFIDALKDNLRAASHIVLVVSDTSLHSEFVNRELASALAKDSSAALRKIILAKVTDTHLTPLLAEFRCVDISNPLEYMARVEELAGLITINEAQPLASNDSVIDVDKVAGAILEEAQFWQTANSSVTITTGPMTVLTAGVVTSFEGNPIDLAFGLPLPLKVVFKFISEPGELQARMEAEASNRAVTLRLYNFDNPLGVGTLKPVQFGQLLGRELWLHFRVHRLQGSEDRTVHYTIYVRTGVT